MIDRSMFPKPGRALPFAPLLPTIGVNDIPAMTDPMGAHWDNPHDVQSVAMNANYVWLERDMALSMCEYSRSLPSGTYEGKCWYSVDRDDVYRMHWYYDTAELRAAGQIGIATRIIIFTDTKEQ